MFGCATTTDSMRAGIVSMREAPAMTCSASGTVVIFVDVGACSGAEGAGLSALAGVGEGSGLGAEAGAGEGAAAGSVVSARAERAPITHAKMPTCRAALERTDSERIFITGLS
jgi:hypothetical protein